MRLVLLASLIVACEHACLLTPSAPPEPAQVSPTESGSEAQRGGQAQADEERQPQTAESHIARDECPSEEQRTVDLGRVLDLAVASIRAEDPGAIEDCVDASPLCEGPPTGERCRYSLRLYREIIHVTLWPEAADGAVVQAEVPVARDLSGPASAARLHAHRWAVSGPYRCRGNSSQRSYGAPTRGRVTARRIGVTCHSGDSELRSIAIREVKKGHPQAGAVGVRGFEPSALPPGEDTPISIDIEPAPLQLRTTNAFEVSVVIGGHVLAPVAEVRTPERLRIRR